MPVDKSAALDKWLTTTRAAAELFLRDMQKDGLNERVACGLLVNMALLGMHDNGVPNKKQRFIIEECWDNFKEWEDRLAAKRLGEDTSG